MAWNEPGGGNRDPWNPHGRRGTDGGGMPEVDQILEKLKSRFKGKGPSPGGLSAASLGLLFGAVGVLWLLSGFFVVDEQERAVVMRFGAFSRTADPGMDYHLPWPIESKETVNVTQVRQVGEHSDMLTQDENIVDVELKIQYRVLSAEKYLFNQSDPDATLRQVTRSAVREVVGRSTMDAILARQDIAQQTEKILQERLDAYNSGLLVTDVNLQSVHAPDPVQDAFLDAIKAGEDQMRLKNEAEAYWNDKLPRARGAAARELAEAVGYRDQLIARATGEASRFSKLLAEYKKAPRVTRDRLYLETMSEVLGNTPKVIVDVRKNGSMLYLPLDQLAKNRGVDSSADSGSTSGSSARAPSTPERSRDRGGR